MCNQRILQPLIILFTSFLSQKHLNYHLKGTTSERSAEIYGEDNERLPCVGDCTNALSFMRVAIKGTAC